MKKISSIILSILIIFSSIISFENSAYGLDEETLRIAIIDTGISSVAISSENLLQGKNYILPNKSTEDELGHGTAVAGIIEGLCPTAKLVPLVYYSKATDDLAYKGDLPMLAQIIRDAVDIYGCRIINISSGAKIDTPTLRDAVAYAEQKGVLIISSAGNDGDNTVYYPAAYSSVLCVGTVNGNNDGPVSFSNRYEGVDLLAPGIRLETVNPKGENVKVNGTSFSTAWVTGAAATLLSKNPSLTPYQIRQILCTTAIDICTEGYDIDSGWGIVDIKKAMEGLEEMKEVQILFLLR